MLDNLSSYSILLASHSPRRKELLASLGLDFRVQTLPDIDESYPADLEGGEIARYIACGKAAAYRPMMKDNELIITADTIVYLDGKVYGKPSGKEEARQMLRELSGKTHHVFTGVCLLTQKSQRDFFADSLVTFAVLSEDEIDWYIEHYHPMDKAGAYGVQEWIGLIAVERIEGSYFNVMGLPVQRLYSELKQMR